MKSKHWIIPLLAMLLSSAAMADPDQGNDACPGTIEINFFTDIGTTVGRVSNFFCLCVPNSANSPDVIYEYTPQVTCDTRISLCGSDFNTGLSVRTFGACPGTLEEACNNDFCGFQSEVRLILNAGQTYWIIVDGYNGTAGNYVLTVAEVAPPPPGENCENPLFLTVPDRQTGTTCGRINDYDEMCPFDAFTPDVVYRYVPSSDQSVTFDLCESDFDTKMYIWEDACIGYPIACNDDDPVCAFYRGNEVFYPSRLRCAPLSAGHTYFVVVDGYAGCGNYVLTTYQCLAPAVPSPVQGLTASLQGDSIRLSWLPVTTDTSGNPIYIDYYRIFACAAADSSPVGTASTMRTQYDLLHETLYPYLHRFYYVTAVSTP